MLKTAVALAALVGTFVLPEAAIARPAGSHLRHLGHMGLGTQVDPARLKGRPRAYAVALGAGTGKAAHARTHKHVNARVQAERNGYKRVSDLTSFPAFYPGIGAVFVRPATLPVGPFLAFDRKDNLSSTIYMISLEEMNSHKKFEAVGTRKPKVDHVTVYYHGGHPGVDFPHYHYVLWHVSKKDEAKVAK